MKLGITALAIFLFSLPFTSCVSTQTKQITAKEDPLKIAIVPCEVIGVPQLVSDISGGEKRRTERRISNSLQSRVFDNLFDQVLLHHPQTVNLQAYSDTNTLLEINGITANNLPQITTAELARLLNVDAVLRISIQQSAGHTTGTSRTADNPGSPKDDNGLSITSAETRVAVNLFDGPTGVPMWGFGKGEMANLGNKHKNIARRITKELGKVLP